MRGKRIFPRNMTVENEFDKYLFFKRGKILKI